MSTVIACTHFNPGNRGTYHSVPSPFVCHVITNSTNLELSVVAHEVEGPLALRFLEAYILLQLYVVHSVTEWLTLVFVFVFSIIFFEVALGSQKESNSVDPLVHILNQLGLKWNLINSIVIHFLEEERLGGSTCFLLFCWSNREWVGLRG